MAELEKRVEGYLDEVCAQVRCRRVHAQLREELRGHLEERIEGYIAAGMDAQQAVRQAIVQMGDGSQVGREFNRTHRPQVDWRMLVLVALFAAAGAAMMAVFGREYGETVFRNSGYFVVRFALYLTIGLVLMLGLMCLDYSRLRKHPMWLYGAAVLLFVLAEVFGVYANGRPYLDLRFFQVSPLPLASPLFIVAFAGLAANYRGGGVRCLCKLVAAGIGSILLMLAYPSLAGALLLLICYATILTVTVAKGDFACRRGITLAVLYGGGALLILVFVGFVTGWKGAYVFQRFGAFLNFGAADPRGAGYIYAISHQWLTASELFGPAQGMAQSLSQSLPDAHRNFAFVSAVATFGWAAGAGILLLAAAFVGRIVQVGRRANSAFGSYLCLGVATMLAAEFLLCTLASLGMLPMLDVGMPFLSYGGTEYVAHLAMVGLVLSVWRYNNLLQRDGSPALEAPLKRFVQFEDGKLIVSFK